MIKQKTKKRKPIKRRSSFNSGLWLAVAFILVLVLAFFFADRGMVTYWRAQEERDELLREIEELKVKKKNLLKEKEMLEKDMDYIEKVAREKYKMKKPGEKVYETERAE